MYFQLFFSFLDKADRVYRQLIGNKPILESLLLKISESGISDYTESSTSTSSSNTHVNQWIQQLAQKYCGDCKNSFEELSKIIQKVMATRRELVAYDKKKYSTEIMTPSVQAPGRCFGCAAAIALAIIVCLIQQDNSRIHKKMLNHAGQTSRQRAP